MTYERMVFGLKKVSEQKDLESAKRKLISNFYNGVCSRGIVIDGDVGYVVVDNGWFDSYKKEGIRIVEVDDE
jgi:hypothetical protein